MAREQLKWRVSYRWRQPGPRGGRIAGIAYVIAPDARQACDRLLEREGEAKIEIVEVSLCLD